MVDVKSPPVYFQVQRNSPYNLLNTAIPFQIEQLNVGGAMNLNSGIFTAPKSGIYFFSFTSLKDWPANPLNVLLYHNSNYITMAHGTNVAGGFTATLSSSISLKSGDQISLRLIGGQLHDNEFHHTNFNVACYYRKKFFDDVNIQLEINQKRHMSLSSLVAKLPNAGI